MSNDFMKISHFFKYLSLINEYSSFLVDVLKKINCICLDDKIFIFILI